MASHHRISLAILLALALLGCQKGDDAKPGTKKTGSGGGSGSKGDALESDDILARTKTEEVVDVKHVLLSWKELAAAFGGQQDPRGAERTQAQAATLAKQVAAKLTPDTVDALIQEHSEDPGSLQGGTYTVTAKARYVEPFKKLALRLKMNEVGIVKTDFGYHVMIRVAAAPRQPEPPPPPPPPPAGPDPLDSADILARPEGAGTMHVQHVLIGWKDAPAATMRRGPPDPRAAARTKEEADKLAVEILGKVRAGGDMAALMKQYSEDPGSADSARAYEVNAAARLVPPFKNLSLRLQLGEAGMVKSDFGWHVIKRIPPPPPPPPDPLDSVAILERKPVTDKATVKHILLGWTDAHTPDPRGSKRTRAELEALVKKTMAALKKGAAIEPLMAELSEDPGSAKDGTGYPVTPDAGLVPPFKELSLRLNVNEIGAVKTQFGIHIIKRVE